MVNRSKPCGEWFHSHKAEVTLENFWTIIEPLLTQLDNLELTPPDHPPPPKPPQVRLPHDTVFQQKQVTRLHPETDGQSLGVPALEQVGLSKEPPVTGDVPVDCCQHRDRGEVKG